MIRGMEYRDIQGRRAASPKTVVLESRATGWHGFPLSVHAASGEDCRDGAIIPHPKVELCLSGSGHNNLWSKARCVQLPFRPGALIVVGRGYEVERMEWKANAVEVAEIQLPPDMVSTYLTEEPSWDLVTRMPVEDKTLASVIVAMRSEVIAGCPSGRMFAESLCAALAIYMGEHYGSVGRPTPSQGQLSSREVRRVVDYVKASLAEDIGVSELAALVRLSASQFTRRFRAATGTSPYRFLQCQRIARALELLRGDDSLAAIAQHVGFANQSHFTSTFRRMTGMTPTQARADGGRVSSFEHREMRRPENAGQ